MQMFNVLIKYIILKNHSSNNRREKSPLIITTACPITMSICDYLTCNTRGWAWTYLGVWVLHPGWVSGRGLVGVRLVVVEVKGLLAAAVVGAPGWTLHHGESQFHVNLRRSSSLDEATAQPVAGWAVSLTDLIGPHAVVLLIQTAYFLPLRAKRRTKGCQVAS